MKVRGGEADDGTALASRQARTASDFQCYTIDRHGPQAERFGAAAAAAAFVCVHVEAALGWDCNYISLVLYGIRRGTNAWTYMGAIHGHLVSTFY